LKICFAMVILGCCVEAFMRATKALIYLDNVAHNVKEAKRLISAEYAQNPAGRSVPPKICIPVKADAYGHGAVPCAKKALESGADCLGVATVDEGAELRAAGISAPVLLFTLPVPEEIPLLVKSCLEPFVFDVDTVSLLNAEAVSQKKHISIHLKIDSGMGRAGCRPEDALGVAKVIDAASHIDLVGVCTHFAVSDSLKKDDVAFTQKQFSVFMQAVDAISAAGIDPGIRHCAASAATLLYPEMHLDMVRPGIMTYGYWPGDYKGGNAELAARAEADLKPVMKLVTSIIALKTVRSGESVSYGRRWTAENDETIAVLPLGYADGLRRSLSPGLVVTVNGTPAPIAGRICMDQCMIRLKDVPDAKRYSEAVIFGDKAQGTIMDAGDAAELACTIPYEILCGITKRVPRVYV
jgi:alanine racemase